MRTNHTAHFPSPTKIFILKEACGAIPGPEQLCYSVLQLTKATPEQMKYHVLFVRSCYPLGSGLVDLFFFSSSSSFLLHNLFSNYNFHEIQIKIGKSRASLLGLRGGVHRSVQSFSFFLPPNQSPTFPAPQPLP